MDVKSLNKEELYKYVLPIIIEINDNYLFLLINSKELKNIFMDYIYKKTLEYNDNDYNNYIKEVIELKYIEIVKERINKEPLKVIDNYFKNYYVDKNNIQDIVRFLRNLDGFFKCIALYDNLDIMCYIVKNNKNINLLLEIVVNNIINDKKYRYLKNNPKLESLIEIYCLVSKIDLEGIDEEIKEINSNYDVNDFFRNGYLDMERIYDRSIRSERLLTYAEEIELGKRIKNGDMKALNILVSRNLRLVSRYALRYVGNGLDLDDLKQEGSLGLMKAASKYDPNKGYKFSTYAIWWINQYIKRAISNDSKLVRIPIHMDDELRRYLELKQKLYNKLGHEPNVYEMMDEYDMNFNYANLMERMSSQIVSLDIKVNEDEDISLIEMIEDTGSSIESQIDNFEEILAGVNLTEKEKEVLRRRYKYNETGEEVGRKTNISRQRVEQLEKSARAKMFRNPRKREELKLFAEQYGVRNNYIVDDGDNISINGITREIDNILYEKNSKLISILRKIGFNKPGCLYFVLRYGFKLTSRMIYKYNCLTRTSCNELERKINSKIKDNKELINYINNQELIIKELGMKELYLRYLNIIKDIYNRSNIVEKLRMIVSYYYAFSNESRFIYILKESKFDVIMIMLLIFRMIFDLDDNKMKLINFKYVKKKEQECFNNIQNSIYKDEIVYYLKNQDLVIKELRLNNLDEDTKELIKRA